MDNYKRKSGQMHQVDVDGNVNQENPEAKKRRQQYDGTSEKDHQGAFGLDEILPPICDPEFPEGFVDVRSGSKSQSLASPPEPAYAINQEVLDDAMEVTSSPGDGETSDPKCDPAYIPSSLQCHPRQVSRSNEAAGLTTSEQHSDCQSSPPPEKGCRDSTTSMLRPCPADMKTSTSDLMPESQETQSIGTSMLSVHAAMVDMTTSATGLSQSSDAGTSIPPFAHNDTETSEMSTSTSEVPQVCPKDETDDSATSDMATSMSGQPCPLVPDAHMPKDNALWFPSELYPDDRFDDVIDVLLRSLSTSPPPKRTERWSSAAAVPGRNVIVPCVAASRVGSDLGSTLKKLQPETPYPVIVLVLHPKAKHACNIGVPTKERLTDQSLMQRCRHIIDMVFWNRQWYDCDVNRRAVKQLKHVLGI